MRRHYPLVILALCLSASAVVRADPINSMAKQLVHGLDGLPSHKIAVLPFQYPNGGLSSGSTLVADRLIASLSTFKNVQVVERTLLPGLFEEMKMEVSGATPSAIQSWGKILAVDGLVVGTLVDLGGGRTEIHARLVQLETGLVLAARTATIDRTWADRPTVPDDTAMNMPDIDSLIRDPVLPPHILSNARNVYETSSDPKERAGALYGIGIILERQGRPGQAALAYRRLMNEFPENSKLKSDAEGRLWATRQSTQ